MTSLPASPSPKRLMPVIDIDTCVSCHACATKCQEWNACDFNGPPTDFNAFLAEQRGVWFNRVFSFEASGEACVLRTVHFPKNCLHCENPYCAVCPTSAMRESYARSRASLCSRCRRSRCLPCFGVRMPPSPRSWRRSAPPSASASKIGCSSSRRHTPRCCITGKLPDDRTQTQAVGSL
jgi:ferredoxin